ncbi:MAG: hypothetical protein AB9M53_03360 [Leptothrix sp. (in: b-proteobacteria)]
MPITTRTFTNRRGLSLIESAVDRCPASAPTHFLAPDQGGIVTALLQGCAAGQTITSAAVYQVPVRDVVIEATASGPGVLTIEDSPDGLTSWTAVDSFPLVAHVTKGYRFAPSLTNYRVKFTASNSAPANQVGVFSQSRT